MKSGTKWTKYRVSARESGWVRESERGEGCWLTLGQCRRGAVAFGSWLWRVHNAYCRPTYHTNVCADASIQRLALPPPLSRLLALSLSPVLSFLSKANTQNLSLFPSFASNTVVFRKLAAFGEANKIPRGERAVNDIDFFFLSQMIPHKRREMSSRETPTKEGEGGKIAFERRRSDDTIERSP